MTAESPRIAVYGAGGHTGRFVIPELVRRGLVPVAVARDASKLAGLGIATRTAAVDDPAALDAALAGAAAVVNCAGPFLDTAEAVAAAALRAGIHYLDVTAEQASAAATFARFDEPARAARVAVVPAMGFYGGLADLLVSAAASGWDALDAAWIAIALDSWHPTPGTRITGARNTAPRVVIRDGAVVPLQPPPAESSWDFPDPFGRQAMVELPFSEVPVIARHLRIATLRSWLNRAPLGDLRDPATPPPRSVDELGRSAQRFRIEAIVRSGGETRRAAASGVDIYAVTAPLVCEAVERILAGAGRRGGAFAAGEVFDANDFLRTLPGLGFEEVVNVPPRGGIGELLAG